MQHFDYKPHGVCPMNISFDLDGDTVHNVSFKGGCNGNLQAISRVVEGMTVEQIEATSRAFRVADAAQAARISWQQRSVRRKSLNKQKEPIPYCIGSFLRFMGWIDAVKQ